MIINGKQHRRVNKVKANHSYEIDAEVRLWKAVIIQLSIDIIENKKMLFEEEKKYKLYPKTTTKTKINELKKQIRESKNWFNIKNEYFLLVCQYAELEPEYVLEKIKKHY